MATLMHLLVLRRRRRRKSVLASCVGTLEAKPNHLDDGMSHWFVYPLVHLLLFLFVTFCFGLVSLQRCLAFFFGSVSLVVSSPLYLSPLFAHGPTSPVISALTILTL